MGGSPSVQLAFSAERRTLRSRARHTGTHMKPATLTWLGHSTFRLETPGGKSVLLDPWVAKNPKCPDSMKAFSKLDLMLVSHGHFDHVQDAVPLAKSLSPEVV